ncbi:MAG: MarR family transcriptional regulator [Butyrivibrio sp.]|nr:MarR family transcriptional regulator [Butyrivibrio sp.]
MECKDNKDPSNMPIAFKLKVISENFASKLNNKLVEDGLTFSQMAILIFLLENSDHDISLKEVSEAAHIKHPTAIGLIKRLEEKGMVSSCVSEVNRKFRIITITDKGKEYLELSKKRHDEMDKALLRPLNETQQSQLSEMLDLILENMNSF